MKIKAMILSPAGQPFGECSFQEASALLTEGRAYVWRFYPYTLMLKPSLPAQVPVEVISPSQKPAGKAMQKEVWYA